MTAKLHAGVIEARKLIIDGVDIGKKVMELEKQLSVEKEKSIIQQQQLDFLKKELENLKK